MQTEASLSLACPCRDLKLDGGRQSAGAVSLKEIIGLEGVELGADGKVRPPGSQTSGLCDRHHKGQEAEAVMDHKPPLGWKT